MILDATPAPLWTDIIQAVGVCLTVPITIWGIFQLFIKDRDKERKISALEQLATAQGQVVLKLNDQVEQLTLQTAHFQYQSSLLLDQNRLFEKQIELQSSIFHHEKGVEEQKLDIEKRKRLGEIKPYLFSSSVMSSPERFQIEIQNKGAEAKNIEIVPINTDFVSIRLQNNSRLEKGASLSITGHARSDKTYLNSNQVTFEAHLKYLDMDDNIYTQNIQRLINGQCIVAEPQLSQPERSL